MNLPRKSRIMNLRRRSRRMNLLKLLDIPKDKEKEN